MLHKHFRLRGGQGDELSEISGMVSTIFFSSSGGIDDEMELQQALPVSDIASQSVDRDMKDLAEDHRRVGVRDIADVKPQYLAYHVKMSVGRTPKPTVRRPRHIIAFRLGSATEIFVARVFHERQLLHRHLEGDDL